MPAAPGVRFFATSYGATLAGRQSGRQEDSGGGSGRKGWETRANGCERRPAARAEAETTKAAVEASAESKNLTPLASETLKSKPYSEQRVRFFHPVEIGGGNSNHYHELDRRAI
jgi:hypothetical protein